MSLRSGGSYRTYRVLQMLESLLIAVFDLLTYVALGAGAAKTLSADLDSCMAGVRHSGVRACRQGRIGHIYTTSVSLCVLY